MGRGLGIGEEEFAAPEAEAIPGIETIKILSLCPSWLVARK